jgi:hypothetical protein
MEAVMMRGYAEGRRNQWRLPIAGIALLVGSTLAALTLPGSAVAEESQTVAPTSQQVVSVRLLPGNPHLWGAEASQRFLLLARFADGLERDVTGQGRFSLSDPQVAEVGAAGKVVARSNGKVVLTAAFQDRTARTQVVIEGILEERPFSFARDIGAVFTKTGCNNSECHGGVKGQGGLKLSVSALFPKEDYRWITEGGIYQVMSAEAAGEKKPRINLQEPAQSLLLLKPTLAVPHGGGQRLNPESSSYRTLLSWIQDGAPYGEEGSEESARIERLEVLPREVVLDRKGQHRLLVTAHLSNGRREDVSEQVLYESNDHEIVEVDEAGVVTARGIGESAVMIRAAGQATSARFGVIAKPLPRYPEVAKRNYVDEHVFGKLKRFNIIPSEVSSDSEFLRRICLDVTGTLPPAGRVRDFVSSRDPDKRDELIETLLNSPEYVEYWTYFFSEVLRVFSGATLNVEHALIYEDWIRKNIARNAPYDRMARERLAAQGFSGPAWSYWTFRDLTPVPEIATEQIRVFLGRRLGCAQCHNHPFENWSQDQFWGLAAFFGDMTQIMEVEKIRGPYFVIDDLEGHGRRKNRSPAKILHPRTKEQVRPSFPDGSLLPASERRDLRMRLAEWMTSPDNPYFAEAIVNRIWGHFLGRGFVEPVDDFRETNPPTHPELLKALSRDFVDHGFDLKHLLRTILRSRTYQLSGEANQTNRDDKVNYSRALPRLLEAPVLLDAITHATGVDSELIVSDEPDASSGAPAGTRAISLIPGMVPSPFFEVYNRNDRRGVPENKPQLTLLQSLHRLSGPTFTSRLTQEGGRVDRLLKEGSSDRQIIEELYLSALTRFPTDRELSGLEAMLAEQPSRREGLQSLTWALVSSREFVHNH